MHLFLITNNNQLIEGVLLAAGQGTIRVAARGCKDTLELRRVGDSMWMTNSGKTFEIASLLAASAGEGAVVDAALHPPKVWAAGGSQAMSWN